MITHPPLDRGLFVRLASKYQATSAKLLLRELCRLKAIEMAVYPVLDQLPAEVRAQVEAAMRGEPEGTWPFGVLHPVRPRIPEPEGTLGQRALRDRAA